MKRNYFNTLNEALESESLLEAWDCCNPPISYGETKSWTYQDGSKYGRQISVYRDKSGRYERPIHYSR